MIGRVDDYGRALVELSVRTSSDSDALGIWAWIDTGFNGELVLGSVLIARLGLTISSVTTAVLADGQQVRLPVYSATIDWFGRSRNLEVIANNGEYPLLGVGLLVGHDLKISYRSRDVEIS